MIPVSGSMDFSIDGKHPGFRASRPSSSMVVQALSRCGFSVRVRFLYRHSSPEHLTAWQIWLAHIHKICRTREINSRFRRGA